MIKTKTINDFSELSFKDEEDFISQCNDFIKNGGDLDALILTSNDKELITLSQYVKSHPLLSSDTLLKLISNNQISSPTDFIYNPKESYISSPIEHSVYWYKNNYEDNKKLIINSFLKLLNQIENPRPIIKTLKSHPNSTDTNYIRTTFDDYDALINLTTEINKSEIYEALFQRFPETKTLFKQKRQLSKFRNDEEDYFFAQKCFNGYDLIDGNVATTFLMNDIISNDFKKDNQIETNKILKHLLYNSNIDGIKKLLNETELSILEAGIKDIYESPYLFAQDYEAVQLLLNKKIPTTKNNSHIFTSADNLNPSTVLALLKNDPDSKILAQEHPEILFKFIKNCSKENYIKFTEDLVKFHNFPVNHFDFLNLVCNKNHYHEYDYEKIKSDFSLLLKLGADVTNNHYLVEQINKNRNEGIKLLRNLKKHKVIDINDPNFLFNFFNQDTGIHPITQVFLDYFGKIDAENYQKLTKEGVPAWWAGTATNNKLFGLSKADLNQTDKAGKPYYFYVCEEKVTGPGTRYNTFEIINKWLIKKEKEEDTTEQSFNYIDHQGNNIFHHILTISPYTHGKQIDFKLLDLIKSKQPTQYFEMLFSKNKNGDTPLDVLLNSKLESNEFQKSRFINSLLTDHKHIDYFSKNKDNLPHYILIAEYASVPELKSMLLSTGMKINLSSQVTKKEDNNKNKVKI